MVSNRLTWSVHLHRLSIDRLESGCLVSGLIHRSGSGMVLSCKPNGDAARDPAIATDLAESNLIHFPKYLMVGRGRNSRLKTCMARKVLATGSMLFHHLSGSRVVTIIVASGNASASSSTNYTLLVSGLSPIVARLMRIHVRRRLGHH